MKLMLYTTYVPAKTCPYFFHGASFKHLDSIQCRQALNVTVLLIYFHKRESKRVLSFSLHHNHQCWQYFRL